MIHQLFSMSIERKISTLIQNCQQMHDAAFELDPVRDVERLLIIDNAILEKKMQIAELRRSQAVEFLDSPDNKKPKNNW